MKKLFTGFIFMFGLFTIGCGQQPLTESDMAAKYGLSMEEFQEQKEAAARMNMSIEDHLGGGHDHMSH